VVVSTSSQRNHREAKPRNAGRNQHMVGVGDVQAEDVEGHMLQRLDVLENRQREEEEEDRQRGQNGQRHIQAAVELLPGAAVGAFGKMLLVVLAHLRGDPGDVISPACQDGAYDSVCALGSCHKIKDSLCKGCVHRHVPARLTWQREALILDAPPSGPDSVAPRLLRLAQAKCPGVPLPIYLVQSDARLLPL
jgi:hypothetical protein